MSCEQCGVSPTPYRIVAWKGQLLCHPCYDTATYTPKFGSAPMIATDDIPGGMYIKHGICHEDGTPKRYDSKSSIKVAAFNAGLTIGGETPKPNPKLQDARAAAKEQSDSGIPGLRTRGRTRIKKT